MLFKYLVVSGILQMTLIFLEVQQTGSQMEVPNMLVGLSLVRVTPSLITHLQFPDRQYRMNNLQLLIVLQETPLQRLELIKQL